MSEQKEKNMPEEKLPEAKLPESAPVSEGEALTALADAILATDEPEEIADVPEDDELEPTHGARGKKEKPEDTLSSPALSIVTAAAAGSTSPYRQHRQRCLSARQPAHS